MMSRLPFNVLVLPFRIRAGRFECAVLQRSDADCWQFIAGGGEGREDPAAAARREAFEEAAIASEAEWIVLDSTASIPRSVFRGNHWPEDVLVIPEHAFAVDVGDARLQLSGEHDGLEWLDYETALQRLTFDSNKTALWELHERLGRVSSTPPRTACASPSGRAHFPAMPNASDQSLRATIQRYLDLVERSSASAAQNERALGILLDQLALAAQATGPAGPETDREAPRRDYKALREAIAPRFPNCGLYRSAGTEPDDEFLVGDAIEDIADIALDLSDVLWLWEYAGETDAMWQFHFDFRTHWGSHLRGLQWCLHEL